MTRTSLVRGALIAFLVSGATAALAQPDRVGDADVTVTSLDRPVSLAVDWRQRTGDDLRWAQDDYDDSAWALSLIHI